MENVRYWLLAAAKRAADMLEYYGDDSDDALPEYQPPGQAAQPYVPATPANPEIYMPIGQPGRVYGQMDVHRRSGSSTNAVDPDSSV